MGQHASALHGNETMSNAPRETDMDLGELGQGLELRIQDWRMCKQGDVLWEKSQTSGKAH